MMKTTNSPMKRLAERLFLATLTTLTILSISVIHENLEQSVMNNLLSSDLQAQLTLSSQWLNPSPHDSLAFTCPNSLHERFSLIRGMFSSG
jgi:hypothetical protein